MKICYIADAGVIHVQKWVNYFAWRGHEIHLISSRPGEGLADGVKLYLLPRLPRIFWLATEYLDWLIWLFRVRRLVQRIKPDILEAQYITLHGYFAVGATFHPLVLVPWGSDVLPTSGQGRIYTFLNKLCLKKADLVIYDSETMKKELLKMGVNPARMSLIYNGIDTQKFSPDPVGKAENKSDSAVVISTRNLRPIYNVEMLIRAIPLVLEQVPQATFIIVGDGDQRGQLEELAISLKVSGNVRFVGQVANNELPGYLSSSGIYVSTSLSDSTSLSLQEAMACELAPVVTDLPANREWIKDGENGFLVPVNDLGSLAERIIHLIKDKETRERFGKAGRKIIRERAEYEEQMARVEELYRQLVEK